MLESGAPLEQTLPKLKEAATAAQQEARFAVLALSSASGTAPFDAALRRYVEFLTADGALEVDVEIDPAILLAPTSRSRSSGSSRRARQRPQARGRRAGRGLDRPEARPPDRPRPRRRRRLRRRRARRPAGPEEHAPARDVDRRRLHAPLAARARHGARGRAPRLASAAARDLVVEARLGDDPRADVERRVVRRVAPRPPAAVRARHLVRLRREVEAEVRAALGAVVDRPRRERLIRVVFPAAETRSIWIETCSVRVSRQPRLPSSQTPFISPPVGLRRTLLTTLKLPRCAIP